MEIEQHVRELVESRIADRPDLFVVDVKMVGGTRLLIQIDGDNGINVQDCADVSRFVGNTLEEDNSITHAYTLEVSSPGVGEPLKLPRQFAKNTGRHVRYILADGSAHEGVLQAATSHTLDVAEEVKVKGKKPVTEQRTLNIADLQEIKVIIKF